LSHLAAASIRSSTPAKNLLRPFGKWLSLLSQNGYDRKLLVRDARATTDRIAVLSEHISHENFSLTLPAARRSLQKVGRRLLTNSPIPVHTAAPQNAVELVGIL
jgi:hypothetical protein